MNTLKSSFLYLAASIVALISFVQNYISCLTTGALSLISREFALSHVQQGHTTSILILGGLIGALLSGFLADRFGRRFGLFLGTILYLVTSFFSLFIFSFPQLLILRFVAGLGTGFTMSQVPLYLAEMAPSVKRGAFVTCYTVSLSIGGLLAYVTSSYFLPSENWRAMFAMPLIPTTIGLIGLFFIPESPRWLMKKGRYEEALAVGNRFSQRLSLDPPQKKEEKTARSVSLFAKPFRFILLVGIVLCVFQQLSGIAPIVHFTPRILTHVGLRTDHDAAYATIIMGIVNVVTTIGTVFLIDRAGRKKLLLLSQAGTIIALIALAISPFFTDLWADRLSLFAVLFFIFAYSLGFGPITWVLISEMYPLSIRAKALGFLTMLSGLSTYAAVLSFPICFAKMDLSITFGIYTLLSLGSFLFFIRYLPETKGKSLEEIEKALVKI